MTEHHGQCDASRADYLFALCRTVPFHIVEAVLKDPTEKAISTQGFVGSVLFADLVGFTAMTERLAVQGEGSTRITSVLNNLFRALLEEAVFPYRGYLIEFGGDSLSAVFRGSDHQWRAAAAALECRRVVHWRTGDHEPLNLRIGLAAGPVGLSVLGDYSQRGVVLGGPSGHRALTLQQKAEPDEIVADDQILDGLRGNVRTGRRLDGAVVLHDLAAFPKKSPAVDLRPFLDTQVEEKIALLEPFVPSVLAGRLRSRPGTWWSEGEMRRLVILFSELWGEQLFSGSGAARDVSRSLVRAFRKYGGVILKTNITREGQRILAVFGLHHPSANDPERAVLAALEANVRMKAFGVRGNPAIQMRTGLHVGKVFYGAIGCEGKHDLTVIGDAVNVAARATTGAGDFEVVVTDAILSTIRDLFQHSALEPIRVKGKRHPLKLHLVHGPSEERAHYVSRRRRQRFCAGRAEIQRELGGLVEATLRDRGQVVGLCGEAGTGKSFMLANMIDHWIEKGGRGVVGRCRYAARSTPLVPAMQILGSFLGLADGDSERDRRERIRQGLKEFDLANGAPELISLLLPVRRPDGYSEALIDLADPQARERVIDSLVEIVERRIGEGRLLCVLEDVHLADTLTITLTKRLARLVTDRPFLFIATFRPDPVVKDLRKMFAREIILEDFSLAEAVELLKHEMAAIRVEHELATFLWQRTRGNPGYLVEVTRFLSDRGLIRVRAGVAQPARADIKALDDIVPPSLAHVALARLDELGSVERRVLRTASVIGRRFDAPLLHRAAETSVDPELLESGVVTLQGRGMIVPSTHLTRGYMFRDSVTRAVAYDTIPLEERRATHARIAETLERLESSDPRRETEVIAQHWERAGRFREAAAWYERSIRVAVRSGLDHEVRDLADRWEGLVAQLPPEERPDENTRINIGISKFVATARLGVSVEALPVGRQITRGPFWESLDEARRSTVNFWLGMSLVLAGETEAARQHLLDMVDKAPRDWLRCDAARELARIEQLSGNWKRATEFLEVARSKVGRDQHRLAQIELVRGNILNDRGELDAARDVYREVGQTACAHGLHRLASSAIANRSCCDLRAGDFAAALNGFQESLRWDHAHGDWLGEAINLVNIGQVMLWSGRVDEAVQPLERALVLGEELGDELTCAEAKIHLGFVVALTKDTVFGQQMCEEGRASAFSAQLREAVLAADLHLLRVAIVRRDFDAAPALMERCREWEEVSRLPLYRDVFERLSADFAGLLEPQPDGGASE